MRNIYLSFLFGLNILIGFCQKPSLNFADCANWPEISGEGISHNGQFIVYSIYRRDFGYSTIVRSVDNTFSREIGDVNATFSDDSRRVIFMKPQDSLCILDLINHQETNIPQCHSFKTPRRGNGKWLAVLMLNNDLILYDLFSEKKTTYPHVNTYSFSEEGHILLIESVNRADVDDPITVRWLDLSNGKSVAVWTGKKVEAFVFDQSETRLAFTTEENENGKLRTKIWHYDSDLDKAEICVDRQTFGVDSGFLVGKDDLKFSQKGDKLTFNLFREQGEEIVDSEAVGLDIWNYRDDYLQSDQLRSLKVNISRPFKAVIDFKKNRVIRLENDNDGLWGYGKLNDGGDDNYLLTETKVNMSEGYRKMTGRPDIILVSVDDGSRKCIKKQIQYGQSEFSPCGKYVLWYDEMERAYFTYNIKSGVIINISINVLRPLWDELTDTPGFPREYRAIAWLPNDEALLVNDRYDIWKIDPTGIRTPVNITNGYGRKNKIIFRRVTLAEDILQNTCFFRADGTLLLSGFNEENKNNGFFKITLGQHREPIQLSMAPAIFYFLNNSFDFQQTILKARNKDIYLLTEQSATNFPNLRLTEDFSSFKPITELQPQKKYNWLTTELVHWKTFDGRPGEGLLYKPENFDQRRKYPIIFYVYEQLSYNLNKYIKPELSTGPMCISWFVSNGYIVFCPDIRYHVGDPGHDIYNYVVSAAKMMGQKSWIDKTKMGIQGHSWGGYEVDFLVTKTKLFAAAASAAGATDLISNSGQAPFGLCAGQSFTEEGAYRMGFSLWQNHERYVNNSPIFGTNKVTTPLLIMHNKEDNCVPWMQGVEFFTSLRRLGKKAWLLQYDGGSHIVFTFKDKLDYSIRLGQYFDHFLKYAASPKWMTTGIPAKLKGIDRGLELTATP